MPIIEPKILKGTRDFGPEEMAKRLFVINKIREVFVRFGYDPIETPAIEYAKTLLGKYGEDADRLTYTFEDNGGRKIALRYDQTVPTARFVAANQSALGFPFKRYQIGPVWRADKPQRGRYREFYQCDIDIIGTDSLLADAEVAKVIDEVFTTLGIKNFVIRVNSRKLIDAIMDACAIKKLDRIDVIRAMDKMDKAGLGKIKKDLQTIVGKERAEMLVDLALGEKVRNRFDQLPDGEAKAEIASLLEKIRAFGVPDTHILLDLTLARGLDYYTGTIYEVVTGDRELGSVCGGGRYDDLTGLFSEKKYPGVGVAFGLDRIMVHLEENGLLKNLGRNSQVLVANFPDMLEKNLNILLELQKKGIPAEMYLEEDKLGKQFKYANKKSIPWIILQGSQEALKKKVMLRNMKTGEQELLTVKQAVKLIMAERKL